MPASQVNVEYFFRLLYDLFSGAKAPLADYARLEALAAHVWLWIVIIGYILSVVGLFVIVYTSVRLFELRKKEEKDYGTLLIAPDAAGSMNPRWKHIESLAGGTNPSEWKEAIMEADIMLDDILTRQGYKGAGVGEKLKEAERADFNTLDDAWEAHKVRNQIAHQGSSFALTDTLAHRAIQRYESVFREFNAI